MFSKMIIFKIIMRGRRRKKGQMKRKSKRVRTKLRDHKKRESGYGRQLINHKYWDSKNLQEDTRYEVSVTQCFQSQAADFYDTRIQKLVPLYAKCLNSVGEYLKNSSTLAVSVPINLSINSDLFVSTAPGKLTLWTRYLLESYNSVN